MTTKYIQYHDCIMYSFQNQNIKKCNAWKTSVLVEQKRLFMALSYCGLVGLHGNTDLRQHWLIEKSTMFQIMA